MPSPQLPASGFGLSDALPYLSAAVTGLVGFFGAQFTAVARLQKTLLDASRQWVEEAQKQHALATARISELESEVLRQRGEINQLLQKVESRDHAIERLSDPPPKPRTRK